MLFLRGCSGFCSVEADHKNHSFNPPFAVFTPHLTVLVPFFFLHRAAFNFLHSRVCHLRLIRLRLVLSSSPCGVLPSMRVSPLALAPIFAQIHRAASAPRPSAPSRACRSTSTSRSAPNPPASPCRPSKTGEWPELCGAAVVGLCSDSFTPSE